MEFTTFDSIKIGLASPEQIRKWSYGRVERPETINYRTQKPEKGGLFCEKIFGPTKDWECYCGKFKKVRFKGRVCPNCGVEITRAKVRRERMGHIELAAPVAHIWYFKGTPACIRQVLGDLSQKDLENIIYFTKYIVTDPGEPDPVHEGQFMTGLLKQQTLTEEEYEEAQKRFPGEFKAEMGAGAILHLLQEYSQDRYDKFRDKMIAEGKLSLEPDQLDVCRNCEMGHNCRECSYCDCVEDEWKNNLDMACEQLKEEVKKLDEKATGRSTAKSQKRGKLLKRLEILEAFRQSGNRPEWMIMTVLPVIPPDIRPMVMLDGGRYATSDLNDLYRRVINRNNRLERMLQLKAPDIIVRNEARMLQEAVDALIDNGRHGKDVTGPNNRKLKSLSDILKGKQGRFRQNLLGKRVDYSGRSVIVVGPELKIYQCGLPKEMALELFKPFVLKRLVDIGKIQNIKSARKMVDRANDDVWDALEHVIKDHPVLLNRAPTLHRLGIQAFEPVLVEGRALKLHPLVCTAFNADFDGDQMAVHLPLSAEAQAEARFLMLAANNLLKPSDGKPVAVPTQDMILGSYYLTMQKSGEPGEGKVFRDVDEAMMAYNEHDITLHSRVRVRVTRETAGKKASRIIGCTVGQLIFNEIIPQDLGFVNRTDPEHEFDLEITETVSKGVLSKIIDRCIRIHGVTMTAEVLDRIKALGYKYSTKSGLTVAVIDATIPPEKKSILAEADAKVDRLNEQYQFGYISGEVKYEQVCRVWQQATDAITEALKANLDPYNPINIMADSGARGSINQLRQLAGMRGLIANTSGATIEIPVRSNYREGLNISEYFISSRGARKGLADTALRTADSGYLTRRLVDVSQDVIIHEVDCGSNEGIEVYCINDGHRDLEKLQERLIGRYLVEDLRDEKSELFIPKTRAMTAADADKIVAAGITHVKIRSVLGCKAKKGVCAKCYGINLANGNLVSVGEAVGIIAAQSIGEPGTQLTMRTFHTGGIANSGDDITQGLPRVEELFEARRPKNGAILAKSSGIVRLSEDNGIKTIIIHDPETDTDSTPYTIPYNYHLAPAIRDGAEIQRGDRLTTGSIYPMDLLEILGVQKVQDYIIDEIQFAYRQQSVDINDKHIEVILRQMMRKVMIADPGSSTLLPEAMVDKRDVDAINAGIQARIDAGETDLRLVTFRPTLLGITKASSSSESFMSAASFQETAKALTDAAINGKSDYLLGLKENVIIGKLIPAGTGMPQYNHVQVVRADGYPAEHTPAAIPQQF
ncbi:MAG: DNA-directed RNA polymerase subunit beta' [Oscillospiraceae bacterium]|nr:DNA-directed RNA polymerase subunit beta' [Oscillospiraceae bacterium]